MIHPWHDVMPGEHVPQEFNAVIEIPFGPTHPHARPQHRVDDHGRWWTCVGIDSIDWTKTFD